MSIMKFISNKDIVSNSEHFIISKKKNGFLKQRKNIL